MAREIKVRSSLDQENQEFFARTNILQGYIKILWETFYEDTAATLKDPAFWTKKFVDKAAGR